MKAVDLNTQLPLTFFWYVHAKGFCTNFHLTFDSEANEF